MRDTCFKGNIQITKNVIVVSACANTHILYIYMWFHMFHRFIFTTSMVWSSGFPFSHGLLFNHIIDRYKFISSTVVNDFYNLFTCTCELVADSFCVQDVRQTSRHSVPPKNNTLSKGITVCISLRKYIRHGIDTSEKEGGKSDKKQIQIYPGGAYLVIGCMRMIGFMIKKIQK